jgi:outer membrane protein assembly factor BamB
MMALDLKGRTWPVEPSENPEFDQGSEHLRNTSRYHHDSFVAEGQMIAMALAFPGITTPIPADESAIVSLTMDEMRMVIGGTAVTPGRPLRDGGGAHVFVALTRGATGIVHDLGVVPGADACVSVMTDIERTIYIATSGPDGGRIVRHPAIPLPFDCFQEWGFSRPGYTELANPVEGEGIACAVLDRNASTIYGLSDRTGTLFAFRIEDSSVEIIGRVDGIQRFSRTMVQDRDGVIWGTAAAGTLWCFDPDVGEIQNTGVRIPAAAAREIHNSADALVLDRVTGVIYGSGSSDGFLFALDPDTQVVRSLGKPSVSQTVRGLAVGNDGRLFGMCGGDDDIGHMFVYSPDDHTMRDLGVPIALFGAREYGYVFGPSVAGPDGEIFFGQTERVSHLWIYYPAVPQRQAASWTGDVQ